MQVWNVLRAARWKCSTQKSPKSRHLGTIAQLCRAISSQLRHVSTTGKKLIKHQYLPTCLHNMVNFGPLAAEISWRGCGTPANFNGFRVLAALLHGTLVVGVSQTLRHWTAGATYIRQGGHHVGHWPTFLVTDYFSGPGIGQSVHTCMCVCLCVRTISFELNDLWSRYLAWWFFLTLLVQLPRAGSGAVSVYNIPKWFSAVQTICVAYVQVENFRLLLRHGRPSKRLLNCCHIYGENEYLNCCCVLQQEVKSEDAASSRTGKCYDKLSLCYTYTYLLFTLILLYN